MDRGKNAFVMENGAACLSAQQKLKGDG